MCSRRRRRLQGPLCLSGAQHCGAQLLTATQPSGFLRSALLLLLPPAAVPTAAEMAGTVTGLGLEHARRPPTPKRALATAGYTL
jgi:hypothetical protein